jgi:hypothetical protein
LTVPHIFKRLSRSAGPAIPDARRDLESQRVADNEARRRESEARTRVQAAENEARRLASEKESRLQGEQNEIRRQASDSHARRLAAENETQHRADLNRPPQ